MVIVRRAGEQRQLAKLPVITYVFGVFERPYCLASLAAVRYGLLDGYGLIVQEPQTMMIRMK